MSCVTGGWTSAAVKREDFTATVRDVLSEKALSKVKVGVSIVKLTDQGPRSIFASNATMPLMPASNLKVVTTSAAMAILGPDFRFRTQLYYRDGDLYIIGDGDPTLGDPELVERIGWKYDTVFNAWADKVAKAGITTVKNVYVDDSIFDQEFVHPNWPANQLNLRYVAQVGGFQFYLNTIDVRVMPRGSGTTVETTPATGYVKITNSTKVGSKNGVSAARGQGNNDLALKGEIPKQGDTFAVTIHDPSLFGATVFLETLRRSGVQVTGGAERTASARSAILADATPFRPVAALETPIATVLARANKDSCNLYAESLAKRLPAAATGKPGSWEGSRQTIGAWLNRIGVPSDQFQLDDGCGLSRGDRVAPDAMVRVLSTDFAAPYRQAYLDSMSVGGVDGTLKKRFNDNLKGRVHAKTGFIDNVSTLSGFLEARDGQWYCFSIMVNGTIGVKPLQDRIVKAIDDDLP